MYVCHCRAVTDWGVRRAIASGARTIADITANCQAGRGCGGCSRMLQRFLDVTLGHDGLPASASPKAIIGE
jgi:bacterioferritin-associated ferredoxin